MVGIVKWLRQRVVAPLCVGSNPATLANEKCRACLGIIRRHSQVVRQRSAKPLFPGSNPGVASNMVGIVKWLRQRVVAPLCVGSNPTIHPIN